MKRLSSINSTGNKCCKEVKEALIDLYINVKVRNDSSMMDIQSEDLESEKVQL
jgi:hypothetical protein